MTPSTGDLVADLLVADVDGERRLLGARCTACATHAFPVQGACPRCGNATEAAALPTRGRVWSWTVQRIAPKPPFVYAGEYEPFTVAYVDLGVVKVEGRLVGRAPGSWTIGDEVTLVLGDDGAAPPYWFESSSPDEVVS
jgi:uncharacterized OB-fold protein